MTKLLVIFDLDGTLANVEHRLHYIRPNPPIDPETGKKVKRRYDLFHRACVDDTLIKPVAFFYRSFISNGDNVIVLSGRDDAVRQETEQWFHDNNLPLPTEMILKTGNQNVADVDQKSFQAVRLEKKYGRPIDMVFEDRLRVVSMWKKRGTFVFDVDQQISK